MCVFVCVCVYTCVYKFRIKYVIMNIKDTISLNYKEAKDGKKNRSVNCMQRTKVHV